MNIFTYGTLMDADIMKHVSGVSTRGENAVLEGYQRYSVDGEQYPGIVENGAGKVEGILYCGISDAALRHLDIFEGSMYSREKVWVILSGDGRILEAMVYVVKPEYENRLTGQPWDFEIFLAKGKRLFEDHYNGFDELREQS